MVTVQLRSPSKRSNDVNKVKHFAYLTECARLLKENPKLTIPHHPGAKLLYVEAENMREIYEQWIDDWLNCRTIIEPNLSKLGRCFGIDDTTAYRILNYMRYIENRDITYDSLKKLGFIKEDE